MAIIQYECDTCKRLIDIPQNKKGMDTFGRCNITDGCKGRLHQVKVKPDHVIGQLTPDEEGLDNWVPRKLLYTHQQPLSSQTWTIKHNLNNQPSVLAYVYLNDTDYLNGTLTALTPTTITVVDENTLTITFDDVQRGVAQCIARSTAKDDVVVTADAIAASTFEAITVSPTIIDRFLTIATLDSSTTVQYDVQFLSANTFDPIDLITLDFISPPFGEPGNVSPWYGTTRILINGRAYTVRTAAINDLPSDGSAFYFTDLPVHRDTFILLTKAPYTEYDRILDAVIDVADMTEAIASTTTVVTDRQMSVSDSLWQTIYPTIRYL